MDADVVTIVVEIPTGSRNKYELDPKTVGIDGFGERAEALEIIAAARTAAAS